MKKRLLVLVSIILVIVVSVIVTLLIIKKDNKSNISKIEIVDVLTNGNSVSAVSIAKENVVKIVNKIDDKYTISGTGFFDKSGYLITNSHIVDIEGDITIIYPTGEESPAKIYSNDLVSDLALLTVENVKVKALPMKSTIDLAVTDEIYSIGYQLNLVGEATVTKGILSAKRVSSGVEFLQTDAAVNAGGSGGPVINDKCELLGIVTLASDNATLSFAISSDTLQLYISKLIENPQVNYINDSRPNNALNVILKEVNYTDEDIYEEKEILDSLVNEEDNTQENDSNVNNNNETNNNSNENSNNNNNSGNNNNNDNNGDKIEEIKDYSITKKTTPSILLETEISSDINTYFELGKDLTNCSLDISSVNISKSGTYPVKLTCDEASSETEIKVYGIKAPNGKIIPADGKTTNIKSLSEIEGIWYYPGYADVCQVFKYNIDIYDWTTLKMNPITGKFQANYGGGWQYDTFEKMTSYYEGALWKDGDYLVVSFYDVQYVLTRTKGTEIYDKISNDYDGCKNQFYGV